MSSSRDRRAAVRAAGGLALLLAGGLAGCGFHLRGSLDMPFKTLYAGFPPRSLIGPEFNRQMRAIPGVVLVDKPKDAEVQLEITAELREREILAFTTTGTPREYQLRTRLRFRAHDGKGVNLIEPSEIVLRREITTSATQLSSAVEEEALLYRDMQTDLVQQLLRRLSAIKR